MNLAAAKKPIILGVLFFLPVTFLLFLYPSSHNYNALDIVYEDVKDITQLLEEDQRDANFSENISVLLFLGKQPMDNATSALNLKEMIYDKFRGFKRFQVIALVHEDGRENLKELEKSLYQYDELSYWHFVFADEEEIRGIFNSLLSKGNLMEDLSFDSAFIIDQELNQRGRIDDRNKNELKRDDPVYGLYTYNCVEVAELKNKMSEDIRILFTEYRQKRKGNFNSSVRRAEDLNVNEKE